MTQPCKQRNVIRILMCLAMLFCSNYSWNQTASSIASNDFELSLKKLESTLQDVAQLKLTHPDSAIFMLNQISRQAVMLPLANRLDFHSRVINEMGNIYRIKGNYLEAINYYEIGIQFSTTHNLTLRKAKIMNALGGLYQELEDLDKAFHYCNTALQIYEIEFPDLEKDRCLLYANVGNLLVMKNNFKDAEIFLMNAIKLNQNLNDDYLSSLIYSGLGLVKVGLKEFQAALDYFKIGLQAAHRIESKDTELAIIANMSSAYIQMKRFSEAEVLLLPAYNESKEIKHKYLNKEFLALLTSLYAESHRYHKAYEFQKEYNDLKSELFSAELNQRLAILDNQLKNIERQNQILELNKLNQAKNFEIKRNRYVLIFVLVLAFLTLALLWFYFQRTKLKNQAKIYQMENQMFRLQMKPHFIFNVLSSIGGFMNQNNPTQAGVYLAKFARLIRNVLEQSKKDLISLNKEIELLKYYVELQQLRFPERFEFSMNTEDIFDTESLLIPPMILQPIVENAIEHGLSKQNLQGKLVVNFIESDDSLIVEVIDNGIGYQSNSVHFNSSDLSHLKNESISSKLIFDQLKLYQTRYKQNFKISIEDLSKNPTEESKQGTRVLLTLPLIHKLN